VAGGWLDERHRALDDGRPQHHFEMGYAPNNATMVVVGDVTPEEIFELCEKFIEPIPQHSSPPAVTTAEPEQLGERRLVVHKQAELPLLMIGYTCRRPTILILRSEYSADSSWCKVKARVCISG